MIKGKYNLGEVAFVDCNFAYNDTSSIVHEYMHHKLCISTIWGFVNFILEQTDIEIHDENLKKLSNTMQKASLVATENYALFHQLVFIHSFSKENYGDFIIEFKESRYYSAYYGRTILDILSKSNIQEILKTNIINTIAFIAMNIDFTKLSRENLLDNEYIEAQIIKSNKYFNPNDRYVILLKSLNKLLDSYHIDDISIDMLLKDTDLEYLENNKENLLKILNLYKNQFEFNNIDTIIINNNIKNIENTSDDNFILREASEDDIYKIFDVIRPVPLNENYKRFKPEKIKKEHLNCQVMRIMLSDKRYYPNNFYGIVIFYDVELGNEYIFFVNKNVLKELIINFNNTIVIYYEDYDRFISEFGIIKSKKIFLEINTSYARCKEFIINDMSPGRETMLHMGNDKVFFTFVKQKDDNIFVMYFFNEVMNLMEKDIEDMVFNIISLDDKGLDGQFFMDDRDWWKFEDIIRVIMGTYIMDMDHKFPTLGRRISIKEHN